MHKFSNQFLDDLDAALDRRRVERRAIHDEAVSKRHGSALASADVPEKGRWDDVKMVREHIRARREHLERCKALREAKRGVTAEELSRLCEECRSSFAEREEIAQGANILKFREALVDAHRNLKPDDLARMLAEIASDREGAAQ